MSGISLDSSSVMLSNNVGVIKKALDMQTRDLMSILNSSSANANIDLQSQQQKQSQVAAATGVGQNIDIKA